VRGGVGTGLMKSPEHCRKNGESSWSNETKENRRRGGRKTNTQRTGWKTEKYVCVGKKSASMWDTSKGIAIDEKSKRKVDRTRKEKNGSSGREREKVKRGGPASARQGKGKAGVDRFCNKERAERREKRLHKRE